MKANNPKNQKRGAKQYPLPRAPIGLLYAEDINQRIPTPLSVRFRENIEMRKKGKKNSKWDSIVFLLNFYLI